MLSVTVCSEHMAMLCCLLAHDRLLPWKQLNMGSRAMLYAQLMFSRTVSVCVCVCCALPHTLHTYPPTHLTHPPPPHSALTLSLAVVIPQIQTRADKEGTTFEEAKVEDDGAVDAI